MRARENAFQAKQHAKATSNNQTPKNKAGRSRKDTENRIAKYARPRTKSRTAKPIKNTAQKRLKPKSSLLKGVFNAAKLSDAAGVRWSAWLGTAVEYEKTLVGKVGGWNGGLGEARGQNLVVDVVADHNEVLHGRAGKLRVMLKPVGNLLT